MANEVCEECGTRCAVGVPRCPQCSSTRLVAEDALSSLVPSLTVCCPNQACPAEGVQRRVGLSQVVPGVLLLPRLVCARCGYELLNLEDIVAKITVHGGPTNEAAEPDSVPVEETPEQGGEESSPDGGTSSTSSEKEPSSPEQSETPDQSPAPTTGSRSGKARTAKRTARSTGGDQADGTSAADDDK